MRIVIACFLDGVHAYEIQLFNENVEILFVLHVVVALPKKVVLFDQAVQMPIDNPVIIQ